MEVEGIRAVVKLLSKPFHASAYVIFFLPSFPIPVPRPINSYLPTHEESPHVEDFSL